MGIGTADLMRNPGVFACLQSGSFNLVIHVFVMSIRAATPIQKQAIAILLFRLPPGFRCQRGDIMM